METKQLYARYFSIMIYEIEYVIVIHTVLYNYPTKYVKLTVLFLHLNLKFKTNILTIQHFQLLNSHNIRWSFCNE